MRAPQAYLALAIQYTIQIDNGREKTMCAFASHFLVDICGYKSLACFSRWERTILVPINHSCCDKFITIIYKVFHDPFECPLTVVCR